MTEKQHNELMTVLFAITIALCSIALALWLSGCTKIQYNDLEYINVGGMTVESIEVESPEATVKVTGLKREWWADIATAIIIIMM